MQRVTYKAFDAVTEFHVKNNQLIGTDPIVDVPYEIALLRIRLILEELGELSIAVHKNDIYLISDGLADLKYVVIGTAVSYGLHLPDDFPPEECLEKIGDIDLETNVGQDYHIQQTPAGRKVLMLATVANAAGIVARHLSISTQPCCGDHPNTETRPLLLDTLIQLDHCIGEAACDYGIPLEAIFFEVHKSNMSKNLPGATAVGDKYAEGSNPKGEGYVPPNIEGIIFERQHHVEKVPQ
jgi:hypothetical protein